MTYPPQGPYGQQPDPYGQQPQQPQQPQYGGGYPQQQPTSQYGAYDPNAQYGGGYQQQYGGFGGPPPPKSNKGPIIAVVSIVVLLLAGLGITGFVAPGFFLSDDEGGNNAGGGGTSTEKQEPDNGADAFIDKLVAAADDKDKDALEDLQCADATDNVTGATKDIDEIDSAEVKETVDESDSEVVILVNIVVDGDDGDYELTITKDGKDWCWQDITSESGGGSGSSEESTDDTSTSESAPGGPATGDSEGEQFVQSFLDKLNSGDGAGAAAMSCSDSSSQADITEAATQSPQLRMDPANTTVESTYVGADLIGTLAGAEASGRTSAFFQEGAWCIYTYFAS